MTVKSYQLDNQFC